MAGGGRLMFLRKPKFSHGIKIFPVTGVSCQGVARFFRWWPGGGVTFFLEVIQFFGGKIHLKISILS